MLVLPTLNLEGSNVASYKVVAMPGYDGSIIIIANLEMDRVHLEY